MKFFDTEFELKEAEEEKAIDAFLDIPPYTMDELEEKYLNNAIIK